MRTRPNIFRVLVFFFAFSIAAFASETSTTLTLSKAIELGLDYSPQVKVSESLWRESEQIKRGRWGLLFPSVDLYANSFLDEWQTAAVHSTYLKAIQPLYRGGLLSSGIKSSQTFVDIQMLNAFTSRQSAIATIVRAYLHVGQAEQLKIVAEQQTEVLGNYTKIVEQYAKLGRSRKMDLLQAQVNLSLSESERVKLLKEKEIAENQLRVLLGANLQGAGVRTEIPSLRGDLFEGNDDKWLALVREQNPDVKILILEREKQESDNGIDLSTDLPSIDFEGVYGYKSGSRSDLFETGANYYSLGISLKIPIFSGLSSLAKRRSHLERNVQKEQAIEQAQLELAQKSKAALLSLKDDWVRWKSSQEAAKQGQAALNMANSAFKNGVASNQDVLNAQRTRFDSEKALIESQYSYLLSALDLYVLLGQDLKSVYGRE